MRNDGGVCKEEEEGGGEEEEGGVLEMRRTDKTWGMGGLKSKKNNTHVNNILILIFFISLLFLSHWEDGHLMWDLIDMKNG